MRSYRDIEMEVLRWSEANGIVPGSTPQGQLLDALNVFGELAIAEAKKDSGFCFKEAIGNIVTNFINYCALKDVDMVECLIYSHEQLISRNKAVEKETRDV